LAVWLEEAEKGRKSETSVSFSLDASQWFLPVSASLPLDGAGSLKTEQRHQYASAKADAD
jgi:hypothetical protein